MSHPMTHLIPRIERLANKAIYGITRGNMTIYGNEKAKVTK